MVKSQILFLDPHEAYCDGFCAFFAGTNFAFKVSIAQPTPELMRAVRSLGYRILIMWRPRRFDASHESLQSAAAVLGMKLVWVKVLHPDYNFTLPGQDYSTGEPGQFRASLQEACTQLLLT